jgi:hypothetical protein
MYLRHKLIPTIVFNSEVSTKERFCFDATRTQAYMFTGPRHSRKLVGEPTGVAGNAWSTNAAVSGIVVDSEQHGLPLELDACRRALILFICQGSTRSSFTSVVNKSTLLKAKIA